MRSMPMSANSGAGGGDVIWREQLLTITKNKILSSLSGGFPERSFHLASPPPSAPLSRSDLSP